MTRRSMILNLNHTLGLSSEGDSDGNIASNTKEK